MGGNQREEVIDDGGPMRMSDTKNDGEAAARPKDGKRVDLGAGDE